jgi:DNA primase
VQLAEAGRRIVHPARLEVWRDFARTIRERVNLADYVEHFLVTLTRTGADELHGACPLCGGEDRFWVRPSWRRWFCRQCCSEGADIITLYRGVNGAGFHEALEDLAGLAGIPLPGEEAGP